jgi:hypothetical protein
VTVKTPEQHEIERLKLKLADAKTALQAMYHLKEGLAKPEEHRPTLEALWLAERVLYGYSTLKKEAP